MFFSKLEVKEKVINTDIWTDFGLLFLRILGYNSNFLCRTVKSKVFYAPILMVFFTTYNDAFYLSMCSFMYGEQGCQKGVLHHLELELQEGGSHNVGAGN